MCLTFNREWQLISHRRKKGIQPLIFHGMLMGNHHREKFQICFQRSSDKIVSAQLNPNAILPFHSYV